MFTFRVYRRTMARRDGERERIVALVKGDATTLADLYPNTASADGDAEPRLRVGAGGGREEA